jgi:hypothetical protein
MGINSVLTPGKRAAAYWFVDGLPDLVFGMMLFVFGAAGFLWQMYAPHPWIYDFSLMLAGFGLFYWKERAVLDYLKAHVTYPRTGYAQPPNEAPPPTTLVSMSLTPGTPANENVTHFIRRTVMTFFWIFYVSFSKDPPRWLAPLLMVALALMLYAMNRGSERPFRWWSTLMLALTGLVFLWQDVPPHLQPLLSMLMAGAWLAAQGAYVLAQYLHANPRPPAPEGVRA